MPVIRIGLIVFSMSNFFLSCLLFWHYKWAKGTLGEDLTLGFYFGKAIFQILIGIAVVAIVMLIYLWIAKPLLTIFREHKRLNNTNSRIAYTDATLFVISLASYFAMVVTICTVVMAITPYKFYPNFDKPVQQEKIKLES